jgi:hypothetical protein
VKVAVVKAAVEMEAGGKVAVVKAAEETVEVEMVVAVRAAVATVEVVMEGVAMAVVATVVVAMVAATAATAAAVRRAPSHLRRAGCGQCMSGSMKKRQRLPRLPSPRIGRRTEPHGSPVAR